MTRSKTAAFLAGVGFSNAEGVKVDRRSKGYGYQVIGQLRPLLGRVRPFSNTPTLTLTNQLPVSFNLCPTSPYIEFTTTPNTLHQRYSQHPFRCYRFALWQEQDDVCGIVVYRPTKIYGIPAVTLLGAYSDNLPTLLRSWLTAMHQQQIRLVHCLTSPAAPLRATLQQLTHTVTPPFARTPYYLTAKPLQDHLSADFLDFGRWNCLGGDIR